jgi:hypothetical protein
MNFSYQTIKDEMLVEFKNYGTFHVLYNYLYTQKRDRIILREYHYSYNLFRFSLIIYESKEIFKVEIGCDNIISGDPLNENIFYIDICMDKYDMFYCNEVEYNKDDHNDQVYDKMEDYLENFFPDQYIEIYYF